MGLDLPIWEGVLDSIKLLEENQKDTVSQQLSISSEPISGYIAEIMGIVHDQDAMEDIKNGDCVIATLSYISNKVNSFIVIKIPYKNI